MLPAPRISKSRIAILKPAPKPEYCLIALIRRRAAPTAIQSAFDDRCGNQDIDLPLHKPLHHRFEFFFFHLTMSNIDTSHRTKLPHSVSHSFDRMNPIVQKIDLTTAMQLAL